MSGGSGYVLSREALRIFAEGQNDTTKCRQEDDHAEDVEMGRCLFNLGVKAGDSRDGQLRNRFYPVAPFVALLSGNMGLDFWLYKYAYYNARSVRFRNGFSLAQKSGEDIKTWLLLFKARIMVFLFVYFNLLLLFLIYYTGRMCSILYSTL